MPEPSVDSQTFHLKRRGQNIAMTVIFLVISVSAFIQTYQRASLQLNTGFSSWWFFLHRL